MPRTCSRRAAAPALVLAGLPTLTSTSASGAFAFAAPPVLAQAPLQRPPWWTPAAEIAALYSWDADLAMPRRTDNSLELLVLLEGGEEASETQASPVVAGAAPSAAGAAPSTPSRPAPRPPPPPAAAPEHATFSLWRVMSFTFLLKSMCIATNVVFQVSPLPIARQFAARGDTGDTDPAPFMSVAFCCCQFSFYGLFAYVATGKSGFLVLVYSNMLGIVMGHYYVYAFVTNCINPRSLRLTAIYLKAIAAVVGVQVAAMLTMPVGRALLFVGLVSSGCGLVSSTSLVTTVPEVIRTRCSKPLPRSLLLVGELSCLLWTACGFTLWDMYIIVPNILCTAITTFALALVWYYPEEPADCPKMGKQLDGYGAAGCGDAVPPRPPSCSPTAGSGEPGSAFVAETGGTWEPPSSWGRGTAVPP